MPSLARTSVLLALALATGPARADEPKPGPRGPAFEVSYAPGVAPGPISARVYVMLGPPDGPRDPRFGPDWRNPQPVFAVDAKDWKPGEPLTIGPDAAGFPASLGRIKAGKYAMQAVVRLNPDTHSIGDGEGNAYGPVVRAELDPSADTVVRLSIDKVVEPRPFRETDRIKLVDIPSPLLSAFHKRPVRHRAAVILPENRDTSKPLPTLWIIPGFGGNHHMASIFLSQPRANFGKDLIRVVLDPDCGTGHHVFADSATNGPRGKALIEELIPHVEQRFRAVAEPGARLLTGHSSGGWSSLWLQVTYPDVFGGTWSTAPDSCDFRDFSRIDLYNPGTNLYRDSLGERRPIARRGAKPMLYLEDFSRLEEVLGDGGQMHSFEAVFSPIGPDGRTRPLWDRETGAIDPETARAWEAFDIRLILRRNWPTLGPKLKGKLHVLTGSLDTFYLDGAAELLRESQATLDSDAVVELVPGKDHGNLLDPELSRRIDAEMNKAVAKYLGREQATNGR